MKKLSFFLMAMLFTCATTLQAAEVTETIAMKGFGGLKTSSYENVTKTGTSDLGTEMVAYAFNPSTGQIRGNKTAIAGASITTKDDSKNWSLYNTQAMPGAIKKITVTQTETGSNKFQNSMYVALGTTNQGAVTTVTGAQKNTTGTATEFTFDIDENQGYTYFKLLSNVKFTSGSVKGAVVTVTYVTAEGGEEEVTKYTITANVNDPAMGAVSGAGEYAEGKTATLTANANPGYKFVNWSNGSTDNPLKITVTEDVEVTANFEAVPPMTCAEAAATADGTTVVLKPFDVVAVVKDAGYTYIEDESGVNLIYDYNLAKELKAGDHVEGFVGVSSPYNGLPELKTSVAYADLTITPGTAPEPTLFTAAPTKADVNKYVKFENVTFTADATFTTSSATNATMVVNGTNVTLRNTFKLAATLSKDKAYNLVGFVAVYNSTIQVYFLSAEEYVAPVVNHTITVSANPAEAGTVTGGGEFEETEEITVKAVANEGYEFVNWTENEVEVSTAAEYTFEVLADRALVANFAKKTYTVTATAENGSVEGLAADGKYEHGAEATLTATAAEGYEFVNWTSGETEVSTANPFTFTVTSDTTLVANFKKAVEEYTITLSGLLKYTNDWRGYTTLQNVEGDTAFFVYNYVDDVPAYGEDYTVTANLGELTLEGTGSWKLIDELETITAVLYNEEGTAVYNVTVSAKAPEVHNLACTDALYVENITDWSSELIITGVIDEDALKISVYDWQEATAGTYYQVIGVLNDEVYIQPDSAVVTIVDTKLTIVFSAKDELDNTYNVNVTATPKPNTPLVVENATFTVDGDKLTITGQWETKSVVVALGGWSNTKYGEYDAVLMTGTGEADDDIYAEFSAVLSKDGTTATLTGVAANWDGTKYDVTISGLAPAETPTALDNVDTAVAPAKVINNGQLIIIRNGVQYNAQGAVVQ